MIQERVSSRNQVPLEWLAVRDMDTQLNQGLTGPRPLEEERKYHSTLKYSEDWSITEPD